MTIRTDLDCAREFDAQDELAEFRDRFIIADADLIYLDGNSLGRLPRATIQRSQALIEQEWGERLIRGWNEHWLELPHRIGGKIARLIGARDDEVVLADSTSVNLFKLAVAALNYRSDRKAVVTDELNFPSDLYVLRSAIESVGGNRRLDVIRSLDGVTIPKDAIEHTIDADTALVALTHTAFKSGWVHDLDAVTSLAHRAGAMMLWDLSHSVGAMPIDLNAANVDLAVGCTYKYLNGGPGAPAFLYVRRDLQSQLLNPIAGWFGSANQFAFSLDNEPAPGITRFLTGTPSVMSLALIEPGVDIVLEAGIDRIRARSKRQTEYLIHLCDSFLEPLGFTLRSPREPWSRGAHVSVGHAEGWRINQALIDRMRVIPDFRHPDNIRLGPSPLATTFAEIHTAVHALRSVVKDRIFEQYSVEQNGVT